MKNKILLLALIFSLLFCQQCNCHKDVTQPDNGLPTATQTGANTLGFLVNGQPWIPAGNNGTPNLSWYYDPNYANGNLGISAYHLIFSTGNIYFGLGGGGIKVGLRTYPINVLASGNNPNDPGIAGIYLNSSADSCSISYYDSTVYRNGQLTITKFDTANGIISGTFYATLYKPSCGDTIKITDGRFDLGR